MPLKPISESQEYNLLSIHKQTQKQQNFKTLRHISQEEKIEMIQTGFQRQAEGKISLKKYYEGTEIHSLFQSKGYSIKNY